MNEKGLRIAGALFIVSGALSAFTGYIPVGGLLIGVAVLCFAVDHIRRNS